MTKQIKETMMRNFGMYEADDTEEFNDSNFGHMAEVIMALCASSFILSSDATVSPATVEEILIHSLERGSKEKTYNLSGKNNIFDIQGASEERKKADDERRDNLAIKKALEDIAKIKEAPSLEWKSEDKINKSIHFEMKKWKIKVNGKNVIALAVPFAPGGKTFWINDEFVTLSRAEAVKFINEKMNACMAGLIGDENGNPKRIGKYFVKYKVADDQELTKFMNESEDREADDGFIPKLVISTNHNVIPTIQNIVMSKSGDKYDELLNMMDTIVQYFIEGENEITKVRQIYQQHVSQNTPSYLVIRMMGAEGQTGMGKGTVKGDVRLSIRKQDGTDFSTVFSMKYGNHKVHNFSSEDVLIEGVTDVYNIASLEKPKTMMGNWQKTVELYRGAGVKRIVGVNKREPIFNKTQEPPLYGRLSAMSGTNQARMLFGFLERFAIGKDKASILRADKNGKKWHVIPSLISDYLIYQEKDVEIVRTEGVNIKLCIKGDDSKLYGILKISESVIMDGEMEAFVEKVKKVFTQPRTDMWTLLSYYKYMDGIISFNRYSAENPIPKVIAERVLGMASHTAEISGKFEKTINQTHNTILSDLDSIKFKNSDILSFMNGELESIDSNEINSYITIMVEKIKELYTAIKTIPVKK